jgi:hypothetical protein
VYTTEMLDAINGKGGINILPDTRLRAGFVANTHINGGLVGDPEGKSSGLPPEPDLLYRQTLIEERERADSLKAGSLSGADDRYPPWLSAVFDRLAKDTKMERSEIESAVREWAWITDALKYVQLGNPERLLIVRDTKRPRPGSKSDR